jgi:hypothetical protein
MHSLRSRKVSKIGVVKLDFFKFLKYLGSGRNSKEINDCAIRKKAKITKEE